jgi:hypothetical protein
MGVNNLITNDTKIIELKKVYGNSFLLSKRTHIKKGIVNTWNSWYKCDGDYYFYKTFSTLDENEDKRYVNEFIGEKLCNLLDLDSIHYEFAKANDRIGIASKNFIKPHNKYYFMPDLYLPNGCANLKNLERIREKCKSDEEFDTFIDELSKLFAIDIYMSQTDRNVGNIQFRKDKTGLHLAPMYDFEFSFLRSNFIYDNTLCGTKDYLNKYKEVYNYIDKIKDKGIDKILDEIEDERKIIVPNELRNDYKKYVK